MQLLRPRDVARILNCSVSEVYALKAKGKLRWLKIGGMVRFRPEDVQEFIDSSVIEVRLEPGAAGKPPKARFFEHLNGDRLLEEWRRRGARVDRPGGRNARSSE